MQRARHQLDRERVDDLDDFDDRPRRKLKKRGKTKLWHKLLIAFGVILVVLSGGGMVAVKMVTDHYEGLVAKDDILSDVPMAPPPPKGETAPLNFLILGLDTRSEEEATDPDATGNRSDVIMIAHVSKDRRNAFIFSIPRDSYVNVPAGGKWKGGKNKINSAMAYGGASLAAKTVYELTKIPLNGAVIVNFQGIQSMVRAVGGVKVCIPYTVNASSGRVWQKGCHSLNPADAEEFVRQRKGVPGGDLGRIKNQQHVIKGLIGKVKQDGILTNPPKLNALLTTAAQSLTVDKTMNLTALALEMKDIDQEAIKFATTPIVGTMTTAHGSSVELDMAGAEQLFAAVRDDHTDEWLAAHPQPEVASL